MIVEGQQHDYSAEQTALLTAYTTTQLEPGARIDTVTVYDIAAGTRPSAVELHGVPGTPGVYVDLT